MLSQNFESNATVSMNSVDSLKLGFTFKFDEPSTLDCTTIKLQVLTKDSDIRYCPDESFSVSLDVKICDSLYQITPMINLNDDSQPYSLSDPYDLLPNMEVLDPFKRYRVEFILNNLGTYSLKVEKDETSELEGSVSQDFSLYTEPELEDQTEDKDF